MAGDYPFSLLGSLDCRTKRKLAIVLFSENDGCNMWCSFVNKINDLRRRLLWQSNIAEKCKVNLACLGTIPKQVFYLSFIFNTVFCLAYSLSIYSLFAIWIIRYPFLSFILNVFCQETRLFFLSMLGGFQALDLRPLFLSPHYLLP